MTFQIHEPRVLAIGQRLARGDVFHDEIAPLPNDLLGRLAAVGQGDLRHDVADERRRAERLAGYVQFLRITQRNHSVSVVATPPEVPASRGFPLVSNDFIRVL